MYIFYVSGEFAYCKVLSYNKNKQQDLSEYMPEICRFLGIVIAIYYKDHVPPHFHAKYENQTGIFSIEDLRLIEGNLPKRIISLVLE
jgi:hypothetical protein